MTSTPSDNGRLCNQIIRNLAVSIVAEKHDLHVRYANNDLIKQLGIDLFCGKNIFKNEMALRDETYFKIYNSAFLDHNLYPDMSFFQTKEIINFLYNYLHSDKIKSNIIDKNPFNKRYNTNNDLFIHVRLGDVVRFNPGINYYLNTISKINFDNIYIASDDTKHKIIEQIVEKYPNAKIIDYNEIETIQFGSTCKNIILSHGTFSSVIGYLAFFSTINYPEYNIETWWHGDIFSIDGWIKHNTN